MSEARTHASLQPKVLIVEDEVAQREVLRYNLTSEGFAVVTAEDGQKALDLVEEECPDLILLDWMIPNTSGLEVCRRLKLQPRTRHIPIIMLSARSEEVDRIRGLETGADDYMIKPYSVLELVARVKAQVRRSRPALVGSVIEFDNITLDPEAVRVYVGGKPVHLGPTEYRLLMTLMEKPGRVFTREQLLDRVWGRDIYIDTRTVDVHVGRLRKAICQTRGDYPLRTVRGAGYALG
ncbi:MAG: phosphate regulon transcriptional regulatory protein PhoB [Rhodobacterales bacterium 65-51]|uniref:phosphate regulon transcriptional regulator PhoB n=1 Tax=uncultured Gemmobacter sp. TaxID=1095917 RepID=UPI000959F137|nr:phosphate regulon transcriptional regulator PhoB [uncultured Gemmobacter sp.]OJY30053.1 MAG: phosphate regulon transcriptional regulatory protein PhoB [Rhodobacterales bacterium 65-51]